MSKEKVVVSKPTINEEVFSKSEFTKAKFLYTGFQRDVFSVVLEEGRFYSKEEAEEKLNAFLKGELK